MSGLRQSLQDYLALRRGLGFKLHAAGQRLQDFVSFLEAQQAEFITTACTGLGATTPIRGPRWVGTTLGLRSRFRPLLQCH